MINNLQNTNFKSRILISRQDYLAKPLVELRKSGRSVDSPWTMQQAGFFCTEGFTDDIEDCTAGILKAKRGNEFYMFHFDPEEKFQNSWDKLEEGLSKVVDKLKNGNPNTPLEAFLVGSKLGYKNSVDQAWNLLGFLQERCVNVGAMLFQEQNGLSHLYYSLPNDEMTVFTKGLNPIKDMNDLEYKYSCIMQGNHQFEFRGNES